MPVDYGIDREVEIVDDADNVTGTIFKVQLKATASRREPPTITVKADHLTYWRAMDLPVLLVLYRAHDRSLWWCWAHHHELHLRNDPRNVSASMPNEWSTDTREHLLEDVGRWRTRRRGHMRLPVRLSLTFDATVDPAHIQVARASIRAACVPLASLVQVVGPFDPTYDAMVALSSDEVIVSLPIGTSSRFSHPPNASELAADVLVAVADCLWREGVMAADMSRLVAAAAPACRLIATDAAPRLASIIAEAGDEVVLDQIATSFHLRGDHELAIPYEFQRARLSLNQAADVAGAIRQLDEARVTGHEVEIGTAEHRLARAHLANKDHRSAQAHLNQAALSCPEYLDRSDWWREHAMTNVGLDLWVAASNDYRRAVDLGDRESLGRLAHTLVVLGEYATAEPLLAEVVADPDLVLGRWRLLHVAVQVILSMGIGRQTRCDELELRSALEAADRSFSELAALDAASPHVWVALAESPHSDPVRTLALVVAVGLQPDDPWIRARALHALLTDQGDWAAEHAAIVAAEANAESDELLAEFAGGAANEVLRLRRALPQVDDPANALHLQTIYLTEPGSVKVLGAIKLGEGQTFRPQI